MKMTKLIREYITDEITKKYQFLIEAAEKEYEESSVADVTHNTTKELNEIVKKTFRERLAPYYAPEDLEAMMNYHATLVTEPYKYGILPIKKKVHMEKINKITSARDKAIKETLIAMELGGSKADLDRMLAAICPEEM